MREAAAKEWAAKAPTSRPTEIVAPATDIASELDRAMGMMGMTVPSHLQKGGAGSTVASVGGPTVSPVDLERVVERKAINAELALLEKMTVVQQAVTQRYKDAAKTVC